MLRTTSAASSKFEGRINSCHFTHDKVLLLIDYFGYCVVCMWLSKLSLGLFLHYDFYLKIEKEYEGSYSFRRPGKGTCEHPGPMQKQTGLFNSLSHDFQILHSKRGHEST